MLNVYVTFPILHGSKIAFAKTSIPVRTILPAATEWENSSSSSFYFNTSLSILHTGELFNPNISSTIVRLKLVSNTF